MNNYINPIKKEIEYITPIEKKYRSNNKNNKKPSLQVRVSNKLPIVSKYNFIQQNGSTPLSGTIKLNLIKYTIALISDGANINFPDADGKTPLMHAIILNNFEIVKLLIDNVANVNTKDESGKTPLIYAVNINISDLANSPKYSQYKYDQKEKIILLLLPLVKLSVDITNYITDTFTVFLIKSYLDELPNRNNRNNAVNKLKQIFKQFEVSYQKEPSINRTKKRFSLQPINQSKNSTNQKGTCFAHASAKTILSLFRKHLPNQFTFIGKNKQSIIYSENNFNKSYNKGNFKNMDNIQRNNHILYFYLLKIIKCKYGCNGYDPVEVLNYIINEFIKTEIKNLVQAPDSARNNVQDPNFWRTAKNILKDKNRDELFEFFKLFNEATNNITFHIKKINYLFNKLPDEIKINLDSGLYPILIFCGNEKFFNVFNRIKKNPINFIDFVQLYYTEEDLLSCHAVNVIQHINNNFKIKNSWGENWGNNGTTWITKNIFNLCSYIIPYFIYILPEYQELGQPPDF